jgi:2-dehydro-3-deoxyphosphogluconate aldolase/(4S)-4-hydroxy-2-oxoglutarate aldolase
VRRGEVTATTQDDVVERLRAARVVAVLRRVALADMRQLAPALRAAGVGALVVTMEGADAEAAVAWLRGWDADILVGCGTILDREMLQRAASLRPDFLVSPHWDPDLAAAAREQPIPYWPGVLTPGEVAAALRYGYRHLKLFPAASVGPGHLRELSGPFPGIAWMPTGGIGRDNVAQYLAAGAAAVGMGSQLAPRDLVAQGAWEAVTAHAGTVMEAARGIPR